MPDRKLHPQEEQDIRDGLLDEDGDIPEDAMEDDLQPSPENLAVFEGEEDDEYRELLRQVRELGTRVAADWQLNGPRKKPA